MNIHLHIERLIVEGLEIGPSGAIDIQAAMQSHLIQLLTQQGLPGELIKTAWVPAAAARPMSISPRIDGTAFGRRAAESLYTGLASGAANAEMQNRNARDK